MKTAYDLMPFQFEKHVISAITDEQGDPWFVGKDACAILQIKNVSDAISRLDDDEKADIVLADSANSKQSMLIISEPGLYRLAMRSRAKVAKTFQRWIAHEVVPQIRKTGWYSVATPTPAQAAVAIAQAVLAVEQRMDILEAKVQGITERQPPAGKLRPGDWLRRYSKPHLGKDLMSLLNAACRRKETPESWRPDGYDWPVPYYTAETIAAAYEEVTKQLYFLHDPGVVYERRRKN